MNIREVLIKALNEFKSRSLPSGGRGRVDLLKADGRCCALGAIGLAIGLSEEDLRREGPAYNVLRYHPAVVALADVIGNRTYATGEPLPPTDIVFSFNDDVQHSDEEVYAVFEKAIARAS